MRRTRLLLVLGLLAALPSRAEQGVAGVEFFEKQVRPLLLEHCQECHGEKKQKGSLRLDSREAWMRGGDSGALLKPGDAAHSLLMRVVSYEDRDLKMPPKRRLSEAQIAVLRQWIEIGAPDPRQAQLGAVAAGKAKRADAGFWSFQLPKPAAPPTVKARDWAQMPVDDFVLARLESEGLAPSPDADLPALLRRLSIDLLGLPPAALGLRLERIEDLPTLVDNMLGQAAFAERWASHWMDLTRFAESSGGGRSLPFKDAWRFRDYLIESIAEDAPVDRMIREMLAGDLMPYENAAQRRRQLTATGFLALGPTNYEEQDKDMLRMDIVDEQLDTMGKAFLGMTLGCARCHDHKFDPISSRDYYAMAGILRSTRTLRNQTDNVAHWVDTPLPLDAHEEPLQQQHEAKIAALEKREALLKDSLRDVGSLALRRKRQILASDLPGVVVDDEQAQKVGEWQHSTRVRPFIGSGYVHDQNRDRGSKTLTFVPKLPAAGRYEVRVAYIGGADRAERVSARVLHADGEDLVYFKEMTEQLSGLQFASLGTWRFEAGGQNFVMISNAGALGMVVVDAVQFLPQEEEPVALAAGPAAKGADGAEQERIKAEMSVLQRQIAQLRRQRPPRPEVMSVREDSAPADAPIHIRGSIRNLGAVVPRGFLEAASHGELPRISAEQSGRLQLAQWLTSPQQPLTARVMVNRVWHWLFGAGLVRSTDNFGSTGELPSHPELLDDLAVRFMQQGWSLKRLVRELVLSRTYRQRTDISPQLRERDPDNRLLARMNRKRLDAEVLRDAMLWASGSLEQRLGGPNAGGAGSVDPNNQKIQMLEYGYRFEDQRRSVYTAAFRNVRHPIFEAFDFADINQVIGQRTNATVATQALLMLNNPQVIDYARKTAQRLLQLPVGDRLPTAFEWTLSRQPTAREQALLVAELPSPGEPVHAAVVDAWARVVQALWALPEFRLF